MELKDFKGWYTLTGVDFVTVKNLEYGPSWDVDACRFTLNGITYQITEDPEDGHRSSMKDIQIVKDPVKNTFKGSWVHAQHITKSISSRYSGSECDLVRFTDMISNKEVLMIGTDDTDDYYPMYVASFNPKNMAINQNKKEKL